MASSEILFYTPVRASPPVVSRAILSTALKTLASSVRANGHPAPSPGWNRTSVSKILPGHKDPEDPRVLAWSGPLDDEYSYLLVRYDRDDHILYFSLGGHPAEPPEMAEIGLNETSLNARSVLRRTGAHLPSWHELEYVFSDIME